MITNNAVNNYHAPLAIGYKAHYTIDVPDVTGDGTDYTFLPDTVDHDFGSDYNIATGVFTIPQTGVYLICSTVKVYNLTPGAGGYSEGMMLIIGGRTLPIYDPSRSSETGGTASMNHTITGRYTAGNTITSVVRIWGLTKIFGVAAGSSIDITWIGA